MALRSLSPEVRSRGYFKNLIREHFDGIIDRQQQLYALVNFEF
jgi:hypothetical protein